MMVAEKRELDFAPLALVATRPALRVQDLTAQHPGADVPALTHVSLEVPKGARVALIGANGAGKSTLLKAVVGLVQVRGGSIEVFGDTFRSMRKNVAYLPQIGELDWRFPVSVRRLVLTGRYVHLGWVRRPSTDDHARANAALTKLGLRDLADRQIGQLSGGQRQRALLARALVQDAELLLLDEPFSAMDAESRDVLRSVLDELRDEGITVVLATHALDTLDLDPDQTITLRDGMLISDTPLAR